jgi:hypothetical protein
MNLDLRLYSATAVLPHGTPPFGKAHFTILSTYKNIMIYRYLNFVVTSNFSSRFNNSFFGSLFVSISNYRLLARGG